MKTFNLNYLILCFLPFFSFANADSLIKPQVRFSPTQIANLKTLSNEYIKCTYGQPFKKGRTVFGNVVPYNQLWRTGANEATELTITSDFMIDSTKIKAGTYSVFSVPKVDKWTLILNKELGQWGTFTYDSTKNVFSGDFPIQKSSNDYEGFTISFEELKDSVLMHFNWETTQVSIPIKLIAIKEEVEIKGLRRKFK